MAIDVEVLLLSSLADLSSDRVCYHLSKLGVRFLRINREQLKDITFLIDPLKANMICGYGGQEWRVGSDLRSVWWRQSTFLRNTPGRALSATEQLERSQWSAAMRGLMLFDMAKWVNSPAATYRAESKPYQLRMAFKLGFDVPDTLITNDRLAPIPSVLGDRLVVKSIDTVLLFEEECQHFGYTLFVDWSECADSEFYTVPVTCQTILSPKLDLRVTIIGKRLWCHSIEVEHKGIEGDWRLRPKSQLIYKEYTIPTEIEERCHNLLKALGLYYGAIDLALSSGRYWFIEINPTGEWGWLDREGSGISEAIARELSCQENS